jgi:hypothetical protein
MTHALSIALLLVSAVVMPFLVLGVLAASVVALAKFAGLVAHTRDRSRARQPAAPPSPAEPAHSYAASSAAGSSTVRREGGTAAVVPSPREELLPLALWRYDQLVQLGVEPVTAAAAALVGVDASAVRSLVESGCSPLVALRILAPA